MKVSLLSLFLAPFLIFQLHAQCCGGGSGCPIAGGASQGVLMEHQMEIGTNLQYVRTHNFLEGDSPIRDFLDDFHSTYLYSRVAYGLSEDLTMSVESGYWITKTQIGLNHIDTAKGNGIGDLLLFPRYTLYRNNSASTSTEVTLGLGLKFPLGNYQDSVRVGTTPFYSRKPLAVQMSSGAQDVIFYAFVFRGYNDWNVNFFANALYIHKGWNSVGEKLGDFASVSVFASTKIFTTLSGVLQLKAEWADTMKINSVIFDNHNPGYEPTWTGYKKIFVSPQLSYVIAPGFMSTLMIEVPIWQFVNGRQIASQFQASVGLSYRFMLIDAD